MIFCCSVCGTFRVYDSGDRSGRMRRAKTLRYGSPRGGQEIEGRACGSTGGVCVSGGKP